ncbi:UDP-N-acetylmuramate dehydrogenase [Acetobacter farinalis]|uniref:UDP-N-acetylenolpyruvoylglucosamine reductase n=1 Tax=Acetobacter farinalis TaxID=1260984 RepID=A0ABT3Q6T2_9PROT|nr:UDP-N-acetylmuramate dehydrogenase [Acetobacter farinalis]MCX2560990.1 UDP-N-acetylmuramate dehydrogenase [Acetobacter farinalis]NHO29760.1 UDP-N-acetylmuramate dehydrogenase [Acetobacter farinalis]
MSLSAASVTELVREAFAETRGRLTPQAPLGPRTWFRVGGAAEWLFQPADAEDLASVMQRLSPELPVTALGACSNVIIRDGGLDGVVIRLARGFSDIIIEEDGLVVGSACLDATVAEYAAQAGLGGLEFLAGIPGSIGGAVRMNAGAYGSDIAAVLDWAEIITRDGSLIRLEAGALRFGYRRSGLPEGALVIRARLRGTPDAPAEIAARIAEIRAARELSQPVRARTGGSTFRNPDPDISPRKAWELIDAAGCRGLRRGDAQVSEKHCNFLINLDQATAADLEGLGEDVRQRVAQQFGVELHWEIKRMGKAEGTPA